jgi:aspergillopepsin I
VADNFQCADLKTKAALPQANCGLGPLYNSALGKFTNITDQKFNINYFPELQSLRGSMGYAPITIGGLTVPKQEVALVDYASWSGDTFTSGLLGLAYPGVTSASSRTGSGVGKYDPLFTTMVKQGLVTDAVFTLAIDRVPQKTLPSAPAGVLALGGLVPSKYYDTPFTSVPIEATTQSRSKQLTFYTTTHELLYGLANGTVVSGGTYQSVVDSGTAPNMIPTAAAAALNKQFVPAAVYNSTLRYWVVDCAAKAPYAAYKIGGKTMPMDPRDMIVRSLNGLRGYEDTCFSAFGDGGDPAEGEMIIGAVWQRAYVVAYDQGRSMMHFAARKPY